MRKRRIEENREFVARQFASLKGEGYDEQTARSRIEQVLGADAVRMLESGQPESPGRGTATARKLAKAADALGADKASVQAGLVQSLGEARLMALDWWRPVRTFLLYLLLLLAIAVGLVAFYLLDLLPKFVAFSEMMHVQSGGAAEWIMSGHGWRLIGPLLLAALLMCLLFAVMWSIRFRMAGLMSLRGTSRLPWLYGKSGSSYRDLIRLEYTAILNQAGVPMADAVIEGPDLVDWPGRERQGEVSPDDSWGLEQAVELGTAADELEWQRRIAWSQAQTRLELSRDRFILFSRVLFYMLIGYLVIMLYMPIFTLAMSVGRYQ